MKSKKNGHCKVPNSYDKLNKRVVWLPPKENTLVSTSRELHSDTSVAVNPLSVDYSLTSEHTNPLNRGASEVSTVLSPSSKFFPSYKTSAAIQPTEVNISSTEQPAGINIPMPHGQGIEKNTKPMIEPLAILYNNNQLADSDF